MAKEVPNRSSEGVRAQLYPRTDFPQQGWIGKATGTGTYYEAITGFGWWSETQGFRTADEPAAYGYKGKQHPFYQTNPQQGWLAKPVLTLYEAYTGFGWYAQTQVTGRTITHPVRSDGWYQDDTVFTVILSQPAYDPAVASWIIQSDRYSIKNDKPNLTDSLYPVNAWSFAATMQDWGIATTRPEKAQLKRWYSSDPQQLDWLIPSVIFDERFFPGTQTPSYRLWKQAVGRWQPDLDQAWVYSNLPPLFDLALYPAISQLNGERTRAQIRLDVERNWALYDISWVHDVIPLTDPIVTTIPPPTVDYQGDGKRTRKRRNRTHELFDELERSLRATMAGPVALAPAAIESASVLDVSQGYEAALDQLLATAGDYQDLSRRVVTLRGEIAAYEARKRQEQLDDDEEIWMMM